MKIFVNFDYKKILFVRQKGFWLDMQGQSQLVLY